MSKYRKTAGFEGSWEGGREPMTAVQHSAAKAGCYTHAYLCPRDGSPNQPPEEQHVLLGDGHREALREAHPPPEADAVHRQGPGKDSRTAAQFSFQAKQRLIFLLTYSPVYTCVCSTKTADATGTARTTEGLLVLAVVAGGARCVLTTVPPSKRFSFVG